MKLLSFLLIQTSVLAAGGHGEAHITDLLVPAGNFIIVFGFIAWKVKTPLKNLFDNNAVKIKELVELAGQKDKEAQIKLETYEKKLAGVDSEVKAILEKAKVDSDLFEKNYTLEAKQTIEKLSKDSESKLESEKNNMIKMLNETLLDEVISKVKNKINTDKNNNDKATNKILAKL